MIVVTGASGDIPRSAVSALVKAGQKVRVLARDPGKAEGLGAAVEVVRGDLTDPSSLEEPFRGADTLLLVVGAGPEMVALQTNALKAARAAGITKVVKVSALGATNDSPAALGRWHATTDRLVRELFPTWVILQPHGFMKNTLGYLGSIRAEGTLYAPLGKGHVCYIDSRDIGEVAAACASSSRWDNQVLELTGGESFSYDQLAATFARVLGRPVAYVDVPPAAAREGMRQAQLPAWLVDDLLVLSSFYASDGAAKPSGTVAAVLGHSPRTIEAFLTEYARG